MRVEIHWKVSNGCSDDEGGDDMLDKIKILLSCRNLEEEH